MKKLFFSLLMILLPMVASADAVEVNGIYYNLITKAKVAEVTSNPNKYSGDIVIPLTIVYEGDQYDVTRIAKSAFYHCTGITSVTIPKTITAIDEYAFSGCTSLNAVYISDIAAWCNISFQYLSNPLEYAHRLYLNGKEVEELVIPSSVTSIGESAFSECTSISSVKIPESVTSIGGGAFYKCINITSINIPNSVTYIGSGAFSGCTNLSSAVIGSGVEHFYFDAFSGCPALSSLTLNCKIIEAWFNKNTTIKEITFGDSVRSITEDAFKECTGITTINFGANIKSVSKDAFKNCNNITTVNVSDINNWCEIDFENYYANPIFYSRNISLNGEVIKDLIISDNVTSIGRNAFYFCKGLNSVSIPPSVENIGEDAFYECEGLTAVHIKNIKAWCSFSFKGMSNPIYYAKHLYVNGNELKELIIPDDVNSIGDYSFYYCSSITNLILGKGVTDIKEEAFGRCENITTINLNEKLKKIGDASFIGCKKLTSINIPNSVISIGSFAFYDCSGLSSITIPENITEIKSRTFMNCSALKTVTIGNKVTTIGNEAFSGCSSLSTVTIGSGIKYIQEKSFASCKELTDVYCYAKSVPSANSSAFQDSYISYATLHIPYISIDLYKAATPWKDFGSIVELPRSSFKLTYKIDGEIYKVYTVEDGTPITPEPAPTKEGSTFCGWSEIPETMPDHDVLVLGSFKYTPGKCGDGVLYTFDGEVLTLCYGGSGTGVMNDYSALESTWDSKPKTPAPWWDYRNLIKKIVIEQGVKTIGKWAFYSCGYVENIEISESVERICEGAIYGITNLKSLTIPNGVEYIDESGVAMNRNLFRINIGTGIKAIYPYAFNGNSINYIYIYATDLPSVSPVAFDEMQYVRLFVPSESLDKYKNAAPWKYSEFIYAIGTKFKLTYIVDGKIYKSYDLEHDTPITPEPEPTKEGFVFSGWSTIPETMPAYDVTVYGSFTSLKCGDNITWNYSNETRTLTISGTGEMWNYTEETTFPWYDIKDGIEKVVIDEGVSTIGDYAFYNCAGAVSVEFPKSITTIGKFAFYGCTGLTSVLIKDIVSWCKLSCPGYGPLYYAHHLYLDGEEVKDLVIPDDVTTIGKNAFSGCTGLTSVTIPGCLTVIDSYAFSDCEGLTSVHISDLEAWIKIDFKEITSNPLYYAHHLYMNNEEIKDLIIPNNVTSIGDYTFWGCSGFSSLTIPKSLIKIEPNVFRGCTGLASIVVDEGNSVYDSRNNCNAIIETAINTLILGCKGTKIPNSIEKIQSFAFEGSEISSIVIPNSVKEIGMYAFARCLNLRKVVIGNGINLIWADAFSSWPLLEDFYCYSGSLFDNSFYRFFIDCNLSNATLHVPASFISNYSSSYPWYQFGNIVALNDFDPNPDNVGYEYVDLGLPSGLLWASNNLGANKPEGYGDYFAWGETSTKYEYSWATYKYANGEENDLTKYSNEPGYGILDNKTKLENDDDVAIVVLGDGWRLPSLAETQELLNNCVAEWIIVNGVPGCKFTGPNGKTIFFPAAGEMYKTYVSWGGEIGFYLTSELFISNYKPSYCSVMYLNYGEKRFSNWHGNYRYMGYSARPVKSKDPSSIVPPSSIEDQTIIGIYDLKGHKIDHYQKGINIVRYKNGSSKKIVK